MSIAHTASSVNVHFIKEAIIMKIMDQKEFDAQNVFGLGQANTAYAKYFIGDSFLHHATQGGGQMLVCTAGEGWYQEEGKAPVSLAPGKVIVIPANVKHWHGAKKDSWFSHIAFEISGENCSNEWCEPMTDEQYNALEG